MNRTLKHHTEHGPPEDDYFRPPRKDPFLPLDESV